MSVSVRIPTILRNYTGGPPRSPPRAPPSPRCSTTSRRTTTGIKARVLDDAGELRRFVNVYVGNDDVRFIEGLAEPDPRGHPDQHHPGVAAAELAQVCAIIPHRSTRGQFPQGLVP